MFATALDLPPELIRRIADELVNSSVVGIDAVDETDTLWSIKDVISQCSLTCRYWSQIFRPYLFWEITLRSLADVEELTAIINSSHSGNAIREHIHVLRVDHRETSVPWLHRVAMLRKELPHCERATLQIESPLLGTSIRTLTSLHPLLPSATPASYSNFTSLTLSSHHFGNFHELVRLVRGLEVLQDLTCSVVTWAARSPIRETERGVRFSKTLVDVSAISCQEHWPQLWLLTVIKSATAAPSSPLLSVPEMAIIAEVIETLLLCGRTPDEPQAYLQFATSMHVVAPISDGQEHWSLVFRSTLSSPALLARFTFSFGVPFSFVSHFALDMKLSKGAPTISSLSEYNPKSVLFDEENQDPLKTRAAFPVRTPSEEVLAIEWEQLAVLIGKMTGAGAVRVGVDATARLTAEEWKHIEEIISGRLGGIGRPCEVEMTATNLQKSDP